MKNYNTCEIEGLLGFRGRDIYMVVSMTYDRDKYLDVIEVWAVMQDGSFSPDHNGTLKKCSDLFCRKFQEENWDMLYAACIKHDNDQAEYFRDLRTENRMAA